MYSRGTPSYRAPELLVDEPTFTNKVDVWGLGCILHKLATLQNAFYDDWAVQKFYESTDPILQISIPSTSGFLQHHVCECIRDLLKKDPAQRPRVSGLSTIFFSYSELLRHPHITQPAFDAEIYPSYKDWWELIADTDKWPDVFELCCYFLYIYDIKGDQETARRLMTGMKQALMDDKTLVISKLMAPIMSRFSVTKMNISGLLWDLCKFPSRKS